MIEMIRNKLAHYGATNAVEEENAIKEIMQEIALYALWRGDFFDIALFQGGTSLRILHGLPRFSEDLDFLLRSPDPEFRWTNYLDVLCEVFAQFGLKLGVQSKDNMDSSIRQAVLKDNSIANQLDLTFVSTGRRRMIKIKLEIDINPPLYSGEASRFLDFPADFEVLHQDLPSNFALKIHALLCRGFLKGRDWYDFSWYAANNISPNLAHLQAALIQDGPWAGENELRVDADWLMDALKTKIAAIKWKDAAQDVIRFLRPTELKSVELWSERFFLAKLEKLARI
jgi:predicted nucleotidyltransferase component of viral defense system